MWGKENNEDWVIEKLYKSDNTYFGVIFMPEYLHGAYWAYPSADWVAGNEALSSASNCCSNKAIKP